MNARKHREIEQATRDWLRLGPKGEQSGSGSLPWPDTNHALPVYRANLNHPVKIAEQGNAANPVPARNRADLTARRVRGEQHWESRRSKRRCVMRRIRPRRSGPKWQESTWNRLHREQQMTTNACWLMRPGAAASTERSLNGHAPVLPSGSVTCRRTVGRPYRVRPYEGSSRMKGNFHVRFLVGGGLQPPRLHSAPRFFLQPRQRKHKL
jgi:hypothetical protein